MDQPRNESGQYVSLEKFVTTIMDERDRSHAREHVIIEQALRKAEELRREAVTQAREVVDERLEKLNELRAEVLTDRGAYMTRDAFDVQLKALEGRIDPLQQFRDKALGFGALVAIVSAVMSSVITALVLGAF